MAFLINLVSKQNWKYDLLFSPLGYDLDPAPFSSLKKCCPCFCIPLSIHSAVELPFSWSLSSFHETRTNKRTEYSWYIVIYLFHILHRNRDNIKIQQSTFKVFLLLTCWVTSEKIELHVFIHPYICLGLATIHGNKADTARILASCNNCNGHLKVLGKKEFGGHNKGDF